MSRIPLSPARLKWVAATVGLAGVLACAFVPSSISSPSGHAAAPRKKAATKSKPAKPPQQKTPIPTESVTFTKDVAPILYQSCVSCHRPGQVGPFPLLTYQDAQKRARQIAQVTRSHYMPPWLPEPGSGQFVGARRLSPAQVETIQKWVQQGAVEGDPHALPPAPGVASGWRLGPPDLIVKMPRPYTLPGETSEVYRSFVLPLHLASDEWLRAIDYRPGNPAIVRHATMYIDTSGTAQQLQMQSGAVGYTALDSGLRLGAAHLGEWTPASAPNAFPEGVAYPLPKGADLVLMLRFHPDGQPEEEQSEVGLYFAKQPPRAVPATIRLGASEVFVGRFQQATVTDSFTLPIAVWVTRVTPHAHPVCRTLRVNAALPDGTVQPLLWIKDWDANWQEPYQYVTPLRLPAGTRLSLQYVFDNSANNPRNPHNPPMTMMPGLEYMEEMADLRIQVVPERPEEMPQLRQALQHRGAALRVELSPRQDHG